MYTFFSESKCSSSLYDFVVCRFGLITDQFMRVKNSSNIFSLGDCSTVQFKKFSEYVERLLDDAGIEQHQELSKEQFAGECTSYFVALS